MRLKDRVALITGASGVIGSTMASRFAQEGAKVVINYQKNAAKAEAVVKSIRENGGEAVSYMADVVSRSDVQRMCEAVVDRFGTIDILVNNAGIAKDSLLFKMTEQEWDDVIDTTLKGSFNCTQFATIPMVKQKYGRIINIASGAIHGQPGQANYAAAKSGLIGFTKSLAFEFARYNIIVNCLALGVIESEMTQLIAPEMKQAMIGRTALRRLGTSIEVANAAIFFASEECSYITGQVVEVRGGAR